MRSYADIAAMAAQDYSIGLEAHYKPLAKIINGRGYTDGIEIGTAYGGNALHLLQNTELKALVCVDPYIYYPAMPGFTCQEEYDTLFEFAITRLKGYKNCQIVRSTSNEFLTGIIEFEQLTGPSFDFVFLDGSHDYEDVKWECENYSQIIKLGGMLCGHDYNIFEGVNKAVDEFAAIVGKQVNTLPGNIWYLNY